MKGDTGAFMAGVRELRPIPDTIVVPTPVAGHLNGPGFPFEIQAQIRGFTVLRRTPPAKAPGGS